MECSQCGFDGNDRIIVLFGMEMRKQAKKLKLIQNAPASKKN